VKIEDKHFYGGQRLKNVECVIIGTIVTMDLL